MNWLISRNTPRQLRLGNLRFAALAVTLFLAGGWCFLPGQVALAAGVASGPVTAAVGSGVAPTPRPPRPQINPVSPNDDTVVRPDDTAASDVFGLPASGIGVTVPAEGSIQRWTDVAVAAFALNALLLFGFAVWSYRRRRT